MVLYERPQFLALVDNISSDPQQTTTETSANSEQEPQRPLLRSIPGIKVDSITLTETTAIPHPYDVARQNAALQTARETFGMPYSLANSDSKRHLQVVREPIPTPGEAIQTYVSISAQNNRSEETGKTQANKRVTLFVGLTALAVTAYKIARKLN